MTNHQFSKTSSNARDRILELAEQACNGTLSAEDYIQLDALLSASHRNCLVYVEYVHLYATLEQMAVGDERPAIRLPDKPSTARRTAIRAACFVLAAVCLLLAVTFYAFESRRRDGERTIARVEDGQPPQIADIRPLSGHALWKVEGQGGEPHVFEDQSVFISEGCIELTLQNGTKLAAEGPGEIILRDDLHVRLAAGALRTTLPEEVSGFRVTTDSMEIVDRGTQFYVAIGEDGLTTSYVSEGICDIRNRFAAEDGEPFRRTSTGECVLIDREKKLVPLDAELSRRFCEGMVSKFLAYEVRIRDASPSVCVISPPDEPLDDLFCSANRPVYLIPEKRGVRLERDLILPGEPPTELPAGSRVDSFLVHNAFGPPLPETGSGGVSRQVRTAGHIVFSQPVVAIASGYDSLAQTDDLFATERARYLSDARRRLRSHDRLSSSSDDPRRVDFDFLLNEGDFEQVRILVQSSWEEKETSRITDRPHRMKKGRVKK